MEIDALIAVALLMLIITGLLWWRYSGEPEPPRSEPPRDKRDGSDQPSN